MEKDKLNRISSTTLKRFKRRKKEKMKIKRKLSNSKGITLIVLVINIVVLLILAGVTIATLTGDNGILTRANEAKEATEIATIEEQIELAKANSLDYDGQIIKQKLKEELNKIEGIDKIEDKTNGVRVEYKGKSQFITTGSGKIELTEEELEQIADQIIQEQGKRDYVIGIDVYGNQVDLANWNVEIVETGSLVVYTGQIQNETIIGEIPAYIIKSESEEITKSPITVLERTFADLTDLKTINVAFPKTIKYYSYTFSGSGITSIPETINLDNAVNLVAMFKDCTELKEIPQSFNLTNASNVQTCESMFQDCTGLTTIPEGFTLPQSIKYASYMFEGTNIGEIPNSLNLKNFPYLQETVNMFSKTNIKELPADFELAPMTRYCRIYVC